LGIFIQQDATIVDGPVNRRGGETMLRKITRKVLEGYLDCKYKAYLKLAGEQGTISEYEQLIEEITILIHQTATDKLNACHRKTETKGINRLDRASLKQGLPLIPGPVFQNAKISFCFDALQRVPGSSAVGEFHYIPVLFDETERPSQKQRSILEIQALILAGLQRKKPDFGMLFHGIGCQVKRVRMKLKDGKSQLMLKEIMEIQAGKQPRFRLNKHCGVCEFYQRCYSIAKAKDDLSLLRRITEKEISKYNKRGIFTVTQLSCTFRARKSRKNSSQKPQPHQHALKALAIRDEKVYVYGTPELPVCNTRIYFDVEGDEERRFSYLIGVIVQTEGNEETHSFWADAQTDERQIYEQFVDVIRHYEDFRLFAYGSYEAMFLRRMLKHEDMRDITEKLLDRVVNMLSLTYAYVYFPAYTNSLKDIARYLGFNWTGPQASGLLSTAWRRKWETTGWSIFKEKLMNYNIEDCWALKLVTEFIYTLCTNRFSDRDPDSQDTKICRVQDIDFPWRKPQWGPAIFAIPDYEIINSCAYFDYQRAKVYVRTNQTARRNVVRKRRHRNRRTNLRPTQQVQISAQECPLCKGSNVSITRDSRLSRVSYDLVVSRTGIKRKVFHVETAWHWCADCRKRFLPRDYLRVDRYFHSLKSWAVYENVVHRNSYRKVVERMRDYFGIPMSGSDVYLFKQLLAQCYAETYRLLLKKIVTGSLIHADETEVHFANGGKGYVWVFTNLEEVVFMYKQSRDGQFLQSLLKDFTGVLVSDFYAPYDALSCRQQKCLIHLMRDFNHDVQHNPWDEEVKSLAAKFGKLMRPIVATIDRYGLKQRHLNKHRRDVSRFFRDVSEACYESDVAVAYQKRLLRYQDKIFTFLNHNGVPWNNNNAEHALKRFAYFREIFDGQISENGLNAHLVLLSIYVSCEYKGLSFLKFLLSKKEDIDTFHKERVSENSSPLIELAPEGFTFSRRKRRPDWDQGPQFLYEMLHPVKGIEQSGVSSHDGVIKRSQINIDTIIVPARQKEFQHTFIEKSCWYAIRIHQNMINKIKHIAAYRVAPISAITHIASVERIELWKNTDRYVLYFSGTPEEIAPITLVPGGLAKALRDRRYTSLQILRRARNLDEVFYDLREGVDILNGDDTEVNRGS